MSFILTDMIPEIKGKVLSFLKLRGSYSEVGNSPIRFAPSLTYPYRMVLLPPPVIQIRIWSLNVQSPWEMGLESHCGKQVKSLNVGLYDTKTTNQYFEPQLSATSGYTTIGINGGLIENKIIEASLTLNQPLGPVQWTSIFNYTLKSTKLKLLRPTTIESGETISPWCPWRIESWFREGSPYRRWFLIGDLYVYKHWRPMRQWIRHRRLYL